MNGEAGRDGADRRGVLALLRALVDSLVDLAHNTARMAASEGRIVLHRLTIRVTLLLAGLLVGAAGLHLLLGGVALLLSRLAGMEAWLALVLVGAAALAAGTAFTIRSIRRLHELDLAFPATLAEFKTDIETLRGEAGDGGKGGGP